MIVWPILAPQQLSKYRDFFLGLFCLLIAAFVGRAVEVHARVNSNNKLKVDNNVYLRPTHFQQST